jgi:ADP-heptose:LPS heptosyltransferase
MPNDDWIAPDWPQKMFAVQQFGKPWACIVRLGAIGDNLIVSSVIPLLAEKYQVEVICQDPNHVIFENNPFISKLTVKKKGDIPGHEDALVWQNWFKERAKEYTFFRNLSHSCEVEGAAMVAQTSFYWGDAYRRERLGRSYLEIVHDICEVRHEFNPRFFPTDEEHQKALETKKKIGERVVGITLSGSRIDKVWPYMALAVSRIIREMKVPVIMFGGPGKDYVIAEQIVETVKANNGSTEGLHNAITPSDKVEWEVGTGEHLKLEGPKTPLWPIRRSLSQIQTCDLVIAVDSGLAWGVAMEAMPKIVMVSHASPRNITTGWHNTVTLHADPERVPCHPCHRLHDDQSMCTPNATNTAAACMSDISVDRVLQEVWNGLNAPVQSTNSIKDVFEEDVGLVLDAAGAAYLRP